MKFAKAFGVGIMLCSVGILLAGGAGTPRKEDVPKYIAKLKSTNAADRKTAADMLGKRGGVSASDVIPAIEPLKTAFDKDRDASVRAAAARALGIIQSDAAGTVPLLIDHLKSESEEKGVKKAVVVALGQFGPDAKEALPTLRSYMKTLDAKKAKEDRKSVQAAIQMISGTTKKKG